MLNWRGCFKIKKHPRPILNYMLLKRVFIFFLFIYLTLEAASPQNTFANHKIGNPFLPGYFADPTIKKFGDTYYIYSTADGIKLASGEPTVWISKDFTHWFNYELDLEVPEGLTNCWAPDVIEGIDGKYYYFMGNCQFGCNIYGYVSDSPMGPFSPINKGKAVIPVGTTHDRLPALDAQYLVDDDGSVYAYFGTWCTTFGGMGVVKIDPSDMFTILESRFIPISEIPLAFEAAYPIKRGNKYFLMYSSGDNRLSSYAVHYSVADNPFGPFTPGKNNPILSTTADGLIDGPGHHSILQEGDEYYIIYHRHDNPHSTNGEFRQLCIDKLFFSDSTTIEKVYPTHSGIKLSKNSETYPPNLAFEVKTSASSWYHLVAEKTQYSDSNYDYHYLPSNATDDNNGTLWKAGSTDLPQSLVLDLGKETSIKRITTEFEYATFYYQYKIEVSSDSITWKIFSDKTANRQSGCPMIDDNECSGRFVRLTITGTENSGMLAAVWNLKVYNSLFDVPAYQNKDSKTGPGMTSTKSLLVDFCANDFTPNKEISQIPNTGTLGGYFISEGKTQITRIDDVKAASFNGFNYLKLSEKAPESLGWNSAFTAAVWVFNPEISEEECLLVWNSHENMLQSSYAALMYGTSKFGAVAHGDWAVDLPYKAVPEKGKWHHIVVTFDGMLENVYVDGQLNSQQPITLYVEPDSILIGTSGESTENFTGYIARAQLFDKPMTSKKITELMETTKPE